MSVRDAFAYLNRIAGIAPLRAPAFGGDDPILPTPFRAGEAAGASLGLAAATANEIWRLRGGTQQDIDIDLKAAAASLTSFTLLKKDGKTVPRPADTNPTVALYQTADARWIHLHGGFPYLAKRTLDLLNADNTADSIASCVAKWNALALEDALAFMNLCGAVVRTEEEWRATPQGAMIADTPPIVLKRVGDAPVLRLPQSAQPLDGVRILDLTRVLAGPTIGRTLASHGAEVLGVRSERLPTIDLFDLDTGHGKRSTFLELGKPSDAEQLRALARDAHVFVDSYRPGALAGLGVTPAALAHSSPGIIHCAVSCYGHRGPWASRRGWEQLAQSATGIAVEQGAFRAARAGSRRESVPALIPAAACDYITGYLGAAGVAAALLRRFREGGSWLVEVSLCATAMWLQSLGKISASQVPASWNPGDGLDAYRQSCETESGHLDFLGPVVRMAATPPRWSCPPPQLGADKAVWLTE
jgi:crotonobetainyl-CoA:carnitine CoA-transferase CaiB-like acyl-CoA transferase